jgi:hypothetical protein
MYRKFRRAAEERAGARIPTRTENDRGAEADELGRQVRPNSCGAGSEHARRRVAASPSRMTARPRWAPVLRDQPASAVSTYDHLVPDPRVATPVNGSRLPEPNRSCAKTATAPGLIPVCTPAVSTRGRQYQYDLQGFAQSRRQDSNLRPPGRQPERSRRTGWDSALYSGSSSLSWPRFALNLIPGLHPVSR